MAGLIVGGGDPVSKRDHGGPPWLVSPPTSDDLATSANPIGLRNKILDFFMFHQNKNP